MSIRIIAVGKKHESWIVDGVERYQKRLKKPFDIEWIILPHSAYDESRTRQEESKRILNRLNDSDYVILLDERGEIIDSPTLSKKIENLFESSSQIVFVIGGAYGVDENLHERANYVWSFSKLVFPHQLVRLMLVEQIYRSQEIASGNHYHHE